MPRIFGSEREFHEAPNWRGSPEFRVFQPRPAILTKRTQFQVYPHLQTGNGNRPTAILTERNIYERAARSPTGMNIHRDYMFLLFFALS